MSPSPFHTDPDAAFLPAARPIYEQLAKDGLAHPFVLHRRSSQAFGLNLFAPLQPEGIGAIFDQIGLAAHTFEAPIFEYMDDADRLSESSSNHPHRTQVDIVLRARAITGAHIVALVEVKFTEQDFGHCSAYANAANPNLEVCRSAGLFGGQPEDCFQLAGHGAVRRRYDHYLRHVPVAEPQPMANGGGCLVRGGRNQPMRNLALAEVLLTEEHVDRVAYVLCAPIGHGAIWRRFGELRAAFRETPQLKLRALTAEFVAAHHPDDGTAIRALYPVPALQLDEATDPPMDPTDDEIEDRLRNVPDSGWDELRSALSRLRPEDLVVASATDQTIPNPQYSDAVWRIHNLLYELPLVIPFDWSHWEGFKRYGNVSDLAGASAADLTRWITTVLRAEHFCDGVLGEHLPDGSFVTALQGLVNGHDTAEPLAQP